MTTVPDEETALASLKSGEGTLIRTTLVADLETPVGAFMKLRRAFAGNAFLLESVEGGTTRGRYSMIGLMPDLIWRCQDGKAELSRGGGPFVPEAAPPLESMRALVAESRLPVDESLPPMAAGIFGYLGYDMVRQMEHLPAAKPDALQVPDAILVRPTVMVVFDAVKDEVSIVTPLHQAADRSEKSIYEAGIERIDSVVAALESPLVLDEPGDVAAAQQPQVSNTDHAAYLAMADRAKELISAGDIFQVVLSQRFDAPFALPPLALYRALRRVNPSPFLCYLDFVDFQIVVSSPEILIRARDGKVTVRPIAGTRRRGATSAEDRALAKDLLGDPKERAEHLMLLDLGRNDAGRVAEIGSVTVTDSFFIEYYSQVMHIVSNIEGRLDPRHDAIDAVIAGFPAGTVSGAPKVRAMQIIDELERDKRGPYGGCIGYFGAGGDMDTCIVLRTAVVKDGMMHVQAGAGIVHDSDPQSEYQECVSKAAALFRAAEEAVRFAARSRRGQ